MTKGNNDTPILLLSLLVTIGLIGAGIWFFGRGLVATFTDSSTSTSPTTENSPEQAGSPSLNTNQTTDTPNLETSLADPTVLTMDGSVTMVALIKQLQLAYTQIKPALPTTYGVPDGRPNGSNTGIENVINGQVLLAAMSRPLTSEERNAGLVGIPIARDALAVVIGVNNPYQGGLTLDQLKQIFQGQITNWSQVGGPDAPIRVINRSPDSGSYTLFQDIVLLGQAFAADSQNFTTAQQDETTPLLQALGSDGITYSTVQQVENQQTIRLVPIEGISPSDRNAVKTGSYPISRVVYLAVPQQTSPAVKAFVDLALSPQGQQLVQRVGFVPLR
ncbi:MAG: PstS family phosphate ABC transporter substrate-binding protein [Elainellaceae cyanobacterium]